MSMIKTIALLCPLVVVLGCATEEFCAGSPEPEVGNWCNCSAEDPDSFCVCAEKIDCALLELSGNLPPGVTADECRAAAADTCAYYEMHCTVNHDEAVACLEELNSRYASMTADPNYFGFVDICTEVFSCNFGE